jgi:uncharacterized protein
MINVVFSRNGRNSPGVAGAWALMLGLFILTGCASEGVTFYTDDGRVTVPVEVADTNEERSQGLMFRESLPENDGMLFVFDEEAPRTFWMKNTKIPLDMIFIGSDMVVDQVTTAQPCVADPCAVYPSIQPVQYVVEVNAGFAKEHGIEAGDRIEINV